MTTSSQAPGPDSPTVTVQEDVPTPFLYSYKTANVFDGKVGLGMLYMRSDPFGASTGYGQLFAQGDYNGIGGSGFGLHFDVDTRFSLFEPRGVQILATDNTLSDASEEGRDAFYRRPLTFWTGRSYDYMRIDQLYVSYDTDGLELSLGRMLITEATQTSVDGLRLHMGLGPLGRAGVFVGLKPNPWHQQVVGAVSGGTLVDGAGQVFAPVWGGILADVFGYTTTGPYANELGFGLPWSQLGSTRFFTSGVTGELRGDTFAVDTAVVMDLFDWSAMDRVWAHATGGWRLADQLTLSFRGTVDVLGARPLSPRDLYLNVSWRNLGPLNLHASYFKHSTLATAYSYGVFFRSLEDPAKSLLNANPFGDDATGVAASQEVLATNLNNAQLFMVDRDRINLEASLQVGPSLQVFVEAFGERRGDQGYSPGIGFAEAIDAMVTGLSGLAAGCSYSAADPSAPSGINPSVPVFADLCRLGGTLGLRDPFLGGLGSFQLEATWLDGYFQSSSRVAGHVGIHVGEQLWLEAGGALENNHNHRVYTSYTPGAENAPKAQYLAQATDAYYVDANLSWRLWEGLFLEASYFAFLEDVPFQGDTVPFGQAAPTPRETSQFTQTLYGRTLYRF